MTKNKKVLVVILALVCMVCVGLFTLTACGKKEVAKLSKIQISKAPDKIVYVQGETFSSAGMEVTAIFSDDTSKVLGSDEYTLTVPDITVPDGEFQATKNVTASYTHGKGENEVTKTANQAITITNKITSATIKTNPTTTEYYLGQTFNPAGMVITAKMENGPDKEIQVTKDNATFSPAEGLAKGTSKVTVTIGGCDIDVNVTVRNALYVEAETGYRNGSLIEQSTGDSGNLRTDSTTEAAQKGAKSLYEAHLKAEFAKAKMKEAGVDVDAYATTAATAAEQFAALGGTESVYKNDVTAGGKLISKLYTETVKWLKDEANKAAIDEYLASDEYTAAVEAYVNGTNTNKAEWDYAEAVKKYTAHAGSDGNEYYLGQNNQGNVISFVFDSSATTTGKVNFRLSNAYLYADSGWTPIIMADIQFNKLCEFYVNGVKQTIPEDKILYGGMTEDGSTNQILWVNWDEVEFDNVGFVQGRNVIELRILNHGITAQESYDFAANIDTLIVLPGKDANNKDTAELDTYDNTKAHVDHTITSVALNKADDGKITLDIAGTLSGSAGYVADLLDARIGSNLVSLEKDADSNNFTISVDVTDYDYGDYAITVTGVALKKGELTINTDKVMKNAHESVALVVADDGSITLKAETDQSVSVDNVVIGKGIKLENKDGKPYLVISGNTAEWETENYSADEKADEKAAVEKAIQKLIYFDIQANADEGASNWTTYLANKHTINVTEDGKFEILVDLSTMKSNNALTVHLALQSANTGTDGWNDYKPAIDQTVVEADSEGNVAEQPLETIKVGNFNYSTIYQKDKYFNCLGIRVAELGSYTVSDVKLVVEGEGADAKLYYVIDASYKTYTKAELEALVPNLNLQGNPHMQGYYDTGKTDVWGLEGTPQWNYYYDFSETITVDEEHKTFQVKGDITALLANGNYSYTTKFALEETENTQPSDNNTTDFKPAVDNFLKYVTVGDKVVVLTYTKNGGNEGFYGCVGLRIADSNTKMVSVNPVSVATENDKAYYVITGSVVNYTKAELEAATLDFENASGGAKTVVDASKIAVTLNDDGTFTVKAEIPDLDAGLYWVHWKGVLGGNGDVGNSAGKAVTVGGKKYQPTAHKFDWGDGNILEITAAE